MKNKWFEVLPQKGGYLLNCFSRGKKRESIFYWNCLSCGWRGAKQAAFRRGDLFLGDA